MAPEFKWPGGLELPLLLVFVFGAVVSEKSSGRRLAGVRKPGGPWKQEVLKCRPRT